MPDTTPANSSPSSASSVADILARMQANGELQSDIAALLTGEVGAPPGLAVPKNPPGSENAAATPTRLHVTTPPVETRAATGNRPAHPESDESDISEYMQRLLKRSSSSTGDHPHAPPAASVAPSAAANTEPLTPWNPDEYVPRAVAPEKNRNLDALREVANQSNRCALETSALNRVQTKSTMFRTASIGLAAFGLLFIVLSGFRFDLSMLLGLASLGGAGWTYWQMQRIRRRCVAEARLELPAKSPAAGENPTPSE